MSHIKTPMNEKEEFLDEIVRKLACVIAYRRGSGGSTYERTKEVWNALETLLNLNESSWNEWIPLIAKRYTPADVGGKDAEYFEENLLKLLKKFAKEAKDYNPLMKRELAKMIRDAMDASTKNPYPELCFYVRDFHPDRLQDERFKDKCKEVVSNVSNPNPKT